MSQRIQNRSTKEQISDYLDHYEFFNYEIIFDYNNGVPAIVATKGNFTVYIFVIVEIMPTIKELFKNKIKRAGGNVIVCKNFAEFKNKIEKNENNFKN